MDKNRAINLCSLIVLECAEILSKTKLPAGSSCSLGNGLLSIGGAAYWVTEDRRSVMSFHLWKECYTTKPLPDADELGYSFHLAMVLGGRLGLAANIYARNTEAVIASFTQVMGRRE